MGLKIYINGKYVDKEQAKVSVFDHGFLYGDGVFEGIRAYNGLIFQLKGHIRRLFKSAEGIQLNIPISEQEVEEAVIDTLKENRLKDAYIRLIITRGIGDLGLDPNNCAKPSVIIITDKISLYPEEFYKKGLKIIVAKTKRNSNDALPPTIKSLNYLNNILAKNEAIQAGVKEAIMLNANGDVCECTGDNIFIIKDGVLMTPSIEAGALEGITRDTVIEIASLKNMKVEKKLLRLEDLYGAEECFLTGTAAEIIPVTQIGERLINDGAVGKLTTEFISEFKELTKNKGVRYEV
jgi:branched-chain amino acid aminotransferase